MIVTYKMNGISVSYDIDGELVYVSVRDADGNIIERELSHDDALDFFSAITMHLEEN